ncbi:MAG: hypothetical protein U5K43_08690 [Halofilum sp. (in: g-proteobacteria)]|nr:hypothetical protein [Halofilum sp. (in: g-proteobacteria)]
MRSRGSSRRRGCTDSTWASSSPCTLDPAHLFAFDLDGRLVAAPGRGARAAA